MAMDTITEAPGAATEAAPPILRAPKPALQAPAPPVGATTSVADAAAPVAKARPVKFPVKFHLAITIEMAESLRRITAGNPLIRTEAEIGRAALHTFLLQSDPQYVHAVSNGASDV